MEFSSPLYPAVILLSAGILGLSLARIFRISPIVGFFILGTAIGSYGLNLVDNHTPGLHFLAELGVCFLLFDVGLHLSLSELRERWRGFLFLLVYCNLLSLHYLWEDSHIHLGYLSSPLSF